MRNRGVEIFILPESGQSIANYDNKSLVESKGMHSNESVEILSRIIFTSPKLNCKSTNVF